MKYISGKDRKQTSLFPISLEDSIDADNSVRAIDQFVDQLDLAELGFRLDYIEERISCLSSVPTFKTLYLRIYEPRTLFSPARERMPEKYRSDVATRISCAGPQHH